VVHVSGLDYLAVAGAGLLAGVINAVVGSGSLITFPTLVAFGLSPYLANVSNNVGISIGNISAIHGYRHELAAQRERFASVAPYSLLGGAAGAIALLVRPGSFRAVVPWLVLLAVGLVIAQPRLSRWLAVRRGGAPGGGAALRLGVFLAGVYGGYFGAAQGVILIAILSISFDETMVRANALKNLAAGIANLIATVIFAIFAPVDWPVAGVLALSSVVGSQLGARVGRRLPQPLLRGIIVVGGTAAAIHLLV
jgi:uncharacterized protein